MNQRRRRAGVIELPAAQSMIASVRMDGCRASATLAMEN